MKKTLTFFLLFMKRLCKKPSFMVILLIMPVMVFGFTVMLKADDDTTRIALYNDGMDEQINELIDRLEKKESMVAFYKTDSVEDLKADVLKNDAECGFVFSDGVWKALVEENAEDMITVYQSTKSSNTDYMKELVFSEMYKDLALDRLKNYLDEYDLEDYVSEEEKQELLNTHYAEYMKEGGVFNITYSDGEKQVESDVAELASDKSYLFKPINGTLAIFMMVASLAGAIFWIIDEKNGVYKTLSYQERPYMNMMVIFIPTMMACLMALICVFIGGVSGGILWEVIKSIVYCILLTGFSNLLRTIIKNEALLCSILTMITVVCIICCDIILNLALMVKGIEAIRWLLPANYYLEKMNDVKGVIMTAVVGIVLIAISVLSDRRKSI